MCDPWTSDCNLLLRVCSATCRPWVMNGPLAASFIQCRRVTASLCRSISNAAYCPASHARSLPQLCLPHPSATWRAPGAATCLLLPCCVWHCVQQQPQQQSPPAAHPSTRLRRLASPTPWGRAKTSHSLSAGRQLAAGCSPASCSSLWQPRAPVTWRRRSRFRASCGK
jgi:hypothetical protein